jgi:septal ring factor EnvC (AmiA/AmiB activator)
MKGIEECEGNADVDRVEREKRKRKRKCKRKRKRKRKRKSESEREGDDKKEDGRTSERISEDLVLFPV